MFLLRFCGFLGRGCREWAECNRCEGAEKRKKCLSHRPIVPTRKEIILARQSQGKALICSSRLCRPCRRMPVRPRYRIPSDRSASRPVILPAVFQTTQDTVTL
ncbi:hypothetical protein SJ05684_c25610 [Sinorhizobium sojae CCBAU 05684]|uniref:Uncharacterized protein n=1 Tax=Sinorhizobium sojae CCBAU 05684 TaxID=716928 RepID=A0A249PDG7_9HYPH|nr:hypothetical protein SJ05684_c25610 [Sinorhizobium sojae CCBAU 05684]